MDAALIDLLRKLFTTHLVPEQCTLLVHLLKLTVTNNPVEVLLAILLRDAQYVERISDHSLLDLIVKRTVSLERWSLVDLEQPWLCI